MQEAFTAFRHACRTADSPYRLGAYRVSNNNRGLVLNRWAPPVATRDLLKLDPAAVVVFAVEPLTSGQRLDGDHRSFATSAVMAQGLKPLMMR